MIHEALIWAIAIGAFSLGAVVGALIGIAVVWDMRFTEGRRYGYNQGREWREDQDMLERLRSLT